MLKNTYRFHTGAEKNLRQGFTLIEMMVVLFIIGMIAVMALPRMSGTTNMKLRSSSRKLAATIGYVYESAILKKTNFRVCFDTLEMSYFIEERSGDEYFPSTDTLLQKEMLSEELFFRKVSVMGEEAKPEEIVCVYFTPYGYVEDAIVQIAADGTNAGYTVITDAMSGKANVYEGFEEGK